MVLTSTEMLSYLDKLRKVKRSHGFVDTSQVEEDFLSLSSTTRKGELTVRKLRTYTLEGEDSTKLKKALRAAGIMADVPSEIGISGGFNGMANDQLFLLSLSQLNADYASHNRAYLNPLLAKVYGEGKKLIRDFSIHEAIFGRARCFAGELDLDEIKLFPERFKPGAYKLSVELDTPEKTIERFLEFSRLEQEFIEDAEKNLKDERKVTEFTERVIKLRETLGAISRCEVPKTNVFSAETNSYLRENGDNTYFYLYNPQQKKNVLVYFGKLPFANAPLDLEVLDGSEQQSTLARLVSLDFYKSSSSVLQQRIKDITQLYEGASRIRVKNLQHDYTNFGKLLEKLKVNQRVLEDMASEEGRKNFTLQQPTEILEFMVCPNNLDQENPDLIDPVVHDLLAHLSWNTNLRNYHDSAGFMKKFKEASSKDREEMLIRVSSGLSFANQQNNDVNLWLYDNYRGFCEAKGIKFRPISE
jgi:hypothetical protein